MRDYVILTDSASDLPPELAAELDVRVVPLSFELDGRHYDNGMEDLTQEQLYACLRRGSQIKTASVNPQRFVREMGEILQSGCDILCLSFSSALSGTYNAAVMAAQELEESGSEGRVVVVDTRCASMGQGLLTYLTVQKKREGASLEEARLFAEEKKERLCHWFTVDDLRFLSRGGRITCGAALIGTVLQRKPVLDMDLEGRLIPQGTVEGRRAALTRLLREMQERADEEPRNQTVFISHGDCEKDVAFLVGLLRVRLGVTDIRIGCLGPVVGSHAGPGTVALFFLGRKRP